MVDPFRNVYDEIFRLIEDKQYFLIELKMHHNARPQPEGLQQIARYMDKQGQQRGYFVLFEKKSSEERPWEVRLRREVHEVDGKEVILLGM